VYGRPKASPVIGLAVQGDHLSWRIPFERRFTVPCTRLKQFLDENNVKYVSTHHSVAYTAQEIAAATHMSGWDLAKTVIVAIDGVLAMVVIPASRLVSLSRLREFTGAREVDIVPESDFRKAFPDCEVGAMPAFGNLYGLPVYLDESLKAPHLTFNAGTHRELLSVDWDDFIELVRPLTGRFLSSFGHISTSGSRTTGWSSLRH
jgi:Ala-tRNA(Pro) deacylase